MKIPSAIRIEKVRYVSDYKLHLLFSDGTEQVLDFGPFLRRSPHPEIQKYLKKSQFRRFKICDGELMWGDFEMLFPVKDLYVNELIHSSEPVARAKAR